MKQILLYECPGLTGNAQITSGQCERNRRRAEKAGSGKKFAHGNTTNLLRTIGSEPLILLEPCLDCPGVFELAERGEISAPTRYDGPMVRKRPAPQPGRPRVGHTVGKRQSRVPGLELEEEICSRVS